MSVVKLYNFPFAKRGDTYNDVEFTISLNNVVQDLTGATIRMWLIDGGTTPRAEYTTINGKIIITNAVGGTFKTVLGVITLAPKVYNYDIEIDFGNGLIKTWIEGIFTVVNDYTK